MYRLRMITTITESAIMCSDGKIYRGKRHCHAFAEAKKHGSPIIKPMALQGFITSRGEFVNRYKAAEIAWVAGQIKNPKKMLFSEDIY